MKAENETGMLGSISNWVGFIHLELMPLEKAQIHQPQAIS